MATSGSPWVCGTEVRHNISKRKKAFRILYSVSPEATDYARTIVWMHGVMGTLLWPAAFTLPQALRAAGDTRFTLAVSSISMWTIRVGFGVLLGRYWGFGVLGIWMAMFIDWLVRILFFAPRFHGHKWESMGLRD